MTHEFGHRVRTWRWAKALAVLGAVSVVAVAVPAATVAAYGPPGTIKVGNPATIQVSTTVNGKAIVRATVPRKYAGSRYEVDVNSKPRATGRVGSTGKILATFSTRKTLLKRGAVVTVVIGGKVVRKIRI